MTLGPSRTYQELRWGDDLDASAAETDSDLESLAQDVLHIISEVRGSNMADPQNGIGAANYLNGTSVQLAMMPRLIDAQLASVSRIVSSRTTLAQQPDGTFLILVVVQVGSDLATLRYVLGPSGLSMVP